MTITRVGSTKKFAEGWEKAFGRKKSARTKGTAKSPTKARKKTKKR